MGPGPSTADLQAAPSVAGVVRPSFSVLRWRSDASNQKEPSMGAKKPCTKLKAWRKQRTVIRYRENSNLLTWMCWGLIQAAERWCPRKMMADNNMRERISVPNIPDRQSRIIVAAQR